MAKKENKLKKQAKKEAKEEKQRMIEKNLDRFVSRLTDKQTEMFLRYVSECVNGDKKDKQYLSELTNEKEKELIQTLIGVSKGKIKVPVIGARDLSSLWMRGHSFASKKPESQYKQYEPIASGYSSNKSDNPKPDNQPSYEPDYDEPPQQPVKFDERLLDELDKHSDEINKYLDGI